MRDKFDIKIEIREDLKKGFIFGLRARPPIGHVLSYIGFRDEVIYLM